MGRYYSLDLRVRVAAFVEAGHSRRAAARHFGVSDSFAIKLVRRQARFGSPAPARQGRPPGSGKLAPYEAFLVQVRRGRARPSPCRNWPLGFWRSMGSWPPRRRSRASSAGTASHIKKSLMAAECARADIRDERRVWTDQRQPACASSRIGWCSSTRPTSTPR